MLESLVIMFPFENEGRRYESNPFIDDGFKRGEIILPGFQIPFTLRPKHYLKFDGFAPDLLEYIETLSIDLRLMMKETIQLLKEGEQFGGFNQGFLLV